MSSNQLELGNEIVNSSGAPSLAYHSLGRLVTVCSQALVWFYTRLFKGYSSLFKVSAMKRLACILCSFKGLGYEDPINGLGKMSLNVWY